MSTQHSKGYYRAFSLNKQTDIYTPITEAKINKSIAMRSFAPIKEADVKISDRAWYGKGNTYATFADRVNKYYQIPATDRSASSLETLLIAALVMGKVQTTQPDSGTNPLEYQHVVTFQDILTNHEVLYTTFVEKLGNEYQKRLSGAYINSFTLTGNRNDHVVLGYEGGGRYYEDNAQAMPAVTASAFFKTLFGLLKLGNSGGALADVSVDVLSWTLTFNQNPTPMYLMGNSSGQEMLIREVLIGDQTVSGNAVLKISAAMRNRFLNQTSSGIQIIAKSSTLINSNPHSLTIDIPKFVIADETFGEEGSVVTYQITFSEETILKGAGELITLTFVSDVTNTDLLVAA